MTRQGGLDFPRLDAHAANFYLVVVAAQIFNIPIRQPTRQVAGAVHAAWVEWVIKEALCGHVRAAQIAPRHAFPADVQLACSTDGHRPLLLIQQVDRGIRDGFADVQRLPGLNEARGGNHGGFSGTVVVDHRETARLVELAQAVATNQQRAQSRVFDILAERILGHRRGQEAYVQWLRAPPGQQRVDVFGAVVGRRQVQGRAHAQRWPDLPGHGVKPETGNAGGMAARVQIEGLAMPVHQVGHGVVLHHHALGQAGGARGVDHISEVGGCHRHLRVARQLRRGVVQIDDRHAQYR